MKTLQSNNGITLLALTVTIIVLIILASISINEGKNLIKDAKVDSIVTNMLTIKGKAKVYAEETNSKIWNLSDEEKSTKRVEIYESDYSMTSITFNNSLIEADLSDEIKNEGYECYSITSNTLEKMGFDELAKEEGDKYAVVYNSKDFTKLDIVYLDGVKYKNDTYFTLSRLQQALEE